MGTNYYAEFGRCQCCNRVDRVHVGKSYRILRAYGDHDVTGSIASWADWRRWLLESHAEVVDEYGDAVDTDAFIAGWTPKDEASEKVAIDNAEWFNMFGTDLGEYVDPDGFRFSRREFS